MNMSGDQQAADIGHDRKCGQLVRGKQQQQQQRGTISNRKQQFSSLILFLSVIIIVNLSPFQSDLSLFQQEEDTSKSDLILSKSELNNDAQQDSSAIAKFMSSDHRQPQVAVSDKQLGGSYGHFLNSAAYLANLQSCLKFIGLMFTNPIRLGKRTTRSIQAEAKVLGKMAKVWYIKKKIKKLSKKLKKHTIAVPVFTAIPIYEHSYYPQPHVTHVSHGGGMHHAAAASSYSPAVTQAMAAAAAASHPVASQASQQLATSASTNHQQLAAYSRVPNHYHHHHQAMYNHPMHAASSQHQIINSYAPSPPLFVDDAGGLYGHYGNAYGRYDGGYQYW